MSNKDILKFFTNPVVGLLPFLIYLLAFYFTGRVDNSLLLALLLSAVSEIIIWKYTKTIACGMMFRMTFIASSITLFTWVFFRNDAISDNAFSVIFEITLVCIFIILGLTKAYINRSLCKRKSVLQKMFLNEFFRATQIVQYIFTLHIFFLYLRRYFSHRAIRFESTIYFIWIPFALILFMIFAENIRMGIFVKKLSREEWLPIVTERGEVRGKVARSVSQEMGNRFLHPIIRVALVCNNRIYLQNRDSCENFDPASLDHPFEKHLLFKEEINLSARNCLAKILDDDNLEFKFSLKYIYEDSGIRRLVFLYIARINDEDQLDQMKLNGKFWSSQQVGASINDGIFCKYFHQEFEYLKNTALKPIKC